MRGNREPGRSISLCTMAARSERKGTPHTCIATSSEEKNASLAESVRMGDAAADFDAKRDNGRGAKGVGLETVCAPETR
jgi:hypothetical protein